MDEMTNAAHNNTIGAAEGCNDAAGGTLLGAGLPAAVAEVASYDLSGVLPEGVDVDEGALASFSALAKESGLSNEQAAKWAKYGIEYADGLLAAQEGLRSRQVADWGQAARQELGVEFNKTLERASVGMTSLERAVPGLRKALDETGAGNRVEFIRLMAKVGELVGEDDGMRLLGGFASRGAGSLYENTDFDKY